MNTTSKSIACLSACLVVVFMLLWFFVLDTNASRRIVHRRIQKYAQLARSHPEQLEHSEELISLANSGSNFQACTATAAFGTIGNAAIPIISDIAELMNSSNPCVSQEAAMALKRLGPLSVPALPQLKVRIERVPNDATTWFAIQALGAIGPPASECLPLLRDKQRSEPNAFKGTVQSAIEKIEGKAELDDVR